MIVTSTSFISPRAGALKLIDSRSVFLIRTRAILRVGHTRAGAIAVVAATHGSFRMRRFKAAQKERPHPATFPVELAEWCIKLHGVSRVRHHARSIFGNREFSAVAAKNCGVKKFIGFEIDEAYLAEARRRIGAQASRLRGRRALACRMIDRDQARRRSPHSRDGCAPF